MAHRGPKSGIRGHGPSMAAKRHAWPSLVRRSHSKDGAYLKVFGSRPESFPPARDLATIDTLRERIDAVNTQFFASPDGQAALARFGARLRTD